MSGTRRRVVHMRYDNEGYRYIAYCDDGTVWILTNQPNATWQNSGVPPIPQPAPTGI